MSRMPHSPATQAREFVKAVALPEPPPVRFDITKEPTVFDAAKEQASVVGSDVIAFVKGITPESRRDIVNASLLAQLVAKKKTPSTTSLANVEEWYDTYFDTLSRIGFVIQSHGFAEYQEKSSTFEAHEAIIEIATTLLSGAPGALALVKTTLGALKKMSDDSPWITLFNHESQSANTARFQVSLVQPDDENGRLLLSLIAFGLEATSTITQVLFFKFHTNDVRLRHNSGNVTIDASLLAAVRDQIDAKLVAYVNEFIKNLPDL
jgi:hypothetical protein